MSRKILVFSPYECAIHSYSGSFVIDQLEALISCSGSRYRWGLAYPLPGYVQASFRFAKDFFRSLRILKVSGRAGRGGYVDIPFFGVASTKSFLTSFLYRSFRKALARSAFGHIDLIHAHQGFPSGYIAFLLHCELGVPYLITEHMGPFPFPSMVKDGMLMQELIDAYAFACEVIAVSPSLARSIEGWSLWKNVKILPNVIPENIFFPDLGNQRRGKEKNGKFIFLFVGGMNKQKGADILLEAIGIWGPPENVRIIFGGFATSRQERLFWKQVRRLGVEKYVHWVGILEREEVASWMRKADAVVMPSRYESFGVAALEALACGKPVVGTKCGGLEYVVQDSRAGVLVDPEDPERLARAMEFLYENYRDYRGDWIYSYYKERFGREKVASEILKLYELILEEREEGG